MTLNDKKVWITANETAAVRILLAHGAGAPADHKVMTQLAKSLADCGCEVIRFEFDYMAQRRTGGSKRPPPPISALVTEWSAWLRGLTFQRQLPLFLAGKSMGGRVATLLNSDAANVSWQGVSCFGYPFHPARQPEKLRTGHLHSQIKPLHIAQGARDALGNQEEVDSYQLPSTINIDWLASADHDLKPLKSSGLDQVAMIEIAAQATARFIETVCQTTLQAAIPQITIPLEE